MDKIIPNQKSYLTAALWSAIGNSLYFLLSFVITAILTHLLTPEDFGIIAIATSFSGFIKLFADAGIGSAVVQFQDLRHEDHQTLFSLSLLIGIFLSIIFSAISPVISAFFSMTELIPVICIISLSFPLTSIGLVPSGILQKRMMFREHSVSKILAAFISGCIGIIMAFSGLKHWAIVTQMVLNSFFTSIFCFISARFMPRPKWNRAIIKKIFSYSGNLTLFSIINYWARNLDNLLIGRFIGVAPLGFYSRAYTLMMLPIQFLTSIINPVFHSAMAVRQNDLKTVYHSYLKLIRVIGTLSIPGITFTILMAPELVLTIWGEQWEKSIPIFTVLGIASVFQPILSTTGTVFLIRNRADWLFRCGIASTFLLCSGIVLGLPYGIKGVAIGYMITSILWATPLLYIVIVRLLGGKLSDFWLCIRIPVLTAFLICTMIMPYNLLYRNTLPPYLHLFSATIIFVVVYMLIMITIGKTTLKEFNHFLPEKFQIYSLKR